MPAMECDFGNSNHKHYGGTINPTSTVQFSNADIDYDLVAKMFLRRSNELLGEARLNAVLKIIFDKCRMFAVPALLRKFPNLRILNLRNCHLNEMPSFPEDIKQQLTDLNLDGNNIKYLEICFKGGYPRLESLSAMNNQIADVQFPQINSTCFHENVTLKLLNLQKNYGFDCIFSRQHGEKGHDFVKRILRNSAQIIDGLKI